MNSFDSQGFRIAYDDDGDGDPIILLHGFAADRRGFRLTADSFFKAAELGFPGYR